MKFEHRREAPRTWGLDRLTGKRDDDRGLVEMCEYGSKAVAAGQYEEVRFYLFNSHEESIVRRTMAERFPSVPFTCDTIFPSAREREQV